VDGSGFSMDNISFIGIVYVGSSGTVNQVITAYQNNSNQGATDVDGYGIWIQGSSSVPSVKVENSTMHDYETDGIFTTGTNANVSDLTVTIKNNNAFSNLSLTKASGIVINEGSDATVSGNLFNGGFAGIGVFASAGSITGNTIVGTTEGIVLANDGMSVKSNAIFETDAFAIFVLTNIQTSLVQHNIIRTVQPTGAGTGIGLLCELQISPGKVNLNTIMDSYYGYGSAPVGFAGSNTYAGVNTEIETCTSTNTKKEAAAAVRSRVLGQFRRSGR
jgi:hypothetical protein